MTRQSTAKASGCRWLLPPIKQSCLGWGRQTTAEQECVWDASTQYYHSPANTWECCVNAEPLEGFHILISATEPTFAESVCSPSTSTRLLAVSAESTGTPRRILDTVVPNERSYGALRTASTRCLSSGMVHVRHPDTKRTNRKYDKEDAQEIRQFMECQAQYHDVTARLLAQVEG